MWFQNWKEPLYYPEQRKGIAASDTTAMITWSYDNPVTLQGINRGDYDTYIQESAKLAKEWTRPLYVRLMHEMNGGWQSFGPGVQGNTPSDFIQAWRHIVNLFRSNGADNVRWVWCPNIVGFGRSIAPFDPLYPGDDYVDWVGLDGYNFGGPTAPWRSAEELFKPSYEDLERLTDKPVMICEWGCGEDGGDKAAWIRETFLKTIPQLMPRVRVVIAFNQKAEADCRINSSPAALSAYREIAVSPMYKSEGPEERNAPTPATHRSPFEPRLPAAK
jgi:beta-mannanase